MRIKVVICTSGNLGFSSLVKLEKEYEIVGVLTDSSSENIIDWVSQKNIKLFKGNPRGKKVFSSSLFFGEFDFLISINYLYLINSDLINLPKKMAINIHGALLPRYRGRAPHIWAIINNERECGITVHQIDEGCDTGDIILQEKIEITSSTTGGDILKCFEHKYPNMIKSAINAILENKELVKQDETQASYYSKRTPEDGEIDWSWDTLRIKNWIRALTSPYPGAFSYINKTKIIIWNAEEVNSNLVAFKVAGYGMINEENHLLVQTGSNVIKIKDFQFEGNLMPNEIIKFGKD